MDGDVVDVSNCQRQVLQPTASVGRWKVDSGAETLQALNPDAKIIKLPMRIDVDNVMDIIKDYDLVVDGSDNFDTRYLVNDACYLAGKTNVHGSIFPFERMATVFAPNQRPCYPCLYPTPPPAGPPPRRGAAACPHPPPPGALGVAAPATGQPRPRGRGA